MEIRRLSVNDYDELLSLLNTTFGNKYGREMDFLSTQPKMWVRDDEHMAKHIGAFDNGVLASVVGIYPLPTVIGGKELLFATTGNVATLPEFEGRGYFTRLFDMAMDEIDNMGVDVARLGGDRVRYGRYGFESAGMAYKFNFNEKNRVKGLGDISPRITFREIGREDAEYLAFCSRVAEGSDYYVRRCCEGGYRDVYLALTTKHSTPYIALYDGRPIGYLSSHDEKVYIGRSTLGRCISEIRAAKGQDLIAIISAWQAYVGGEITVELQPHLYSEVSRLTSVAETASIKAPSRFRVKSFDKLADALIGIRDLNTLPIGERKITIDGYGTLRLWCDGNRAGCEACDGVGDITLDRALATRIFFGMLPTEVHTLRDPFLSAMLPLPLSWSTLDYV